MTPTTNIDAYEAAANLVAFLQSLVADPPAPTLRVDVGTPTPTGKPGGSFVWVLPIGPGDVSQDELVTVLSSAKNNLFALLVNDATTLAAALKPQALADAQALVVELK